MKLKLKYAGIIHRFTKEVTDLLQWMVMINMMGIFCSLTLTLFFTIVEVGNLVTKFRRFEISFQLEQ